MNVAIHAYFTAVQQILLPMHGDKLLGIKSWKEFQDRTYSFHALLRTGLVSYGVEL